MKLFKKSTDLYGTLLLGTMDSELCDIYFKERGIDYSNIGIT